MKSRKGLLKRKHPLQGDNVESVSYGPQKKRKTLTEQLADLTDPTPKDYDTERPDWDAVRINYDEYVDDTPQMMPERFKNVPERRRIMTVSDAPLGSEYRGEKISRQTLSDWNSPVEHNKQSTKGLEVYFDDEEEQFSSMDDESVKESLSEKDQYEDETESTDEEDRMKLLGAKQSKVDKLEDMLNQKKSEEPKSHNAVDLENQWKKANHTKNQRALWDSFMDIRLALQSLLEMGNKFPNPSDRNLFIQQATEDDKPEIEASFNNVTDSLNGFITDLSNLQSKLLKSNPLTSNISTASSDTASYNWDSIQENQRKMEDCFGPIIDNWHTKTLYASGINWTKFKSINQSVMTQVNNINTGGTLASLIKRSQTVDENHKPFGVVNDEKKGEKIDEEIYHDSDFYAHLLHEHIQSGLGNIDPNDPLLITQNFLRTRYLQRKKQSKQKDYRESKGRRLKYNVHEKLTSFMAPETRQYPKQESPMAQELFKSLLGNKKTQNK